jgi:hypothetical protein
MAYCNWKGLVCCHVVSGYTSLFPPLLLQSLDFFVLFSDLFCDNLHWNYGIPVLLIWKEVDCWGFVVICDSRFWVLYRAKQDGPVVLVRLDSSLSFNEFFHSALIHFHGVMLCSAGLAASVGGPWWSWPWTWALGNFSQSYCLLKCLCFLVY